MGMFDYVKYSCKCPVCNSDVKNFQTKDCECAFREKTIDEVDHFYTACNNCNTWIEFNRTKGTANDHRQCVINSIKETLEKLLNDLNFAGTIGDFTMTHHKIEPFKE